MVKFAWVRQFTGALMGIAFLLSLSAVANPPFPPPYGRPIPPPVAPVLPPPPPTPWFPLLNGPTAKLVTNITSKSLQLQSVVIELTRYGLDAERIRDVWAQRDWNRLWVLKQEALRRAFCAEEVVAALIRSANQVRFTWNHLDGSPWRMNNFYTAWWIYNQNLTNAYYQISVYQWYLDRLWWPEGPAAGPADAAGRVALQGYLNAIEALKHELARETCIFQNGPVMRAGLIGIGVAGPAPFCVYTYFAAIGPVPYWNYGVAPGAIPMPAAYPYFGPNYMGSGGGGPIAIEGGAMGGPGAQGGMQMQGGPGQVGFQGGQGQPQTPYYQGNQAEYQEFQDPNQPGAQVQDNQALPANQNDTRTSPDAYLRGGKPQVTNPQPNIPDASRLPKVNSGNPAAGQAPAVDESLWKINPDTK